MNGQGGLDSNSNNLLVSCTGNNVNRNGRRIDDSKVPISIYDDHISCDGKGYLYSQINHLSVFNSQDTTNIIYTEYSSGFTFITQDDKRYDVLELSRWKKGAATKNAEWAGRILSQSTYQFRLDRILSSLSSHGYYTIPLEPWAVLDDNATLQDWKAAGNQDVPPKEKQVKITADLCLERGDGYKVSIQEAFNAGRLFLGTIYQSYGGLSFRNQNPYKIVGSNESLDKKNLSRISFTLSLDSDVILNVLTSIANRKE